MKYIISGTDRNDSKTLRVAQIIQQLYKKHGEDIKIIDLKDLIPHLSHGPFYGEKTPEALKPLMQEIIKSEGIVVVVPEYNGSMPGILKYFIDHMKFPESFEYKPVCFVGLGGRFGGLRPVEHLQQVYSYRNAFLFPLRVFIMNAPKVVLDDKIDDLKIMEQLEKQVIGFQKFTQCLSSMMPNIS